AIRSRARKLSPKASTSTDGSPERVPDVSTVAGIQLADLVPDLRVRFEDLVLLEVVSVLVDDRRAPVFHDPDHQVQVAPALGAFVQRVEAQEVTDHFLEAGVGIVEAETHAVSRENVHLLAELLVEDPRLFEDATLLIDVVLELRHGAQRDSRRSSYTSASRHSFACDGRRVITRRSESTRPSSKRANASRWRSQETIGSGRTRR